MVLEKLSPIRREELDASYANIDSRKRCLHEKITDDDIIKTLFVAEKEKTIKCKFYYKIGSCRHAERCTKLHKEPKHSQTVLLRHFYCSPLNQSKQFYQVLPLHQYTPEELQAHFDESYEEIFIELERKYGELEDLYVCENLGSHMAGNVYAKFRLVLGE